MLLIKLNYHFLSNIHKHYGGYIYLFFPLILFLFFTKKQKIFHSFVKLLLKKWEKKTLITQFKSNNNNNNKCENRQASNFILDCFDSIRFEWNGKQQQQQTKTNRHFLFSDYNQQPSLISIFFGHPNVSNVNCLVI